MKYERRPIAAKLVIEDFSQSNIVIVRVEEAGERESSRSGWPLITIIGIRHQSFFLLDLIEEK